MIYFLFCIHNHQPVGNFGYVLEKAYKDSYWPFLDALSRHPSVKLTLHNTGFLFDWIYENHPEYIELLKTMVERGQVEIMGGGYYEPVLSVIPEADRLGQVRMMSHRLTEVFGVRPRGIWLAERVWEPYLPNVITGAGLEYLLVDDYHFVKAGMRREQLGGCYITEDQGNVVKIFPGNERLRYLIPFKPVTELEKYLKGLEGGLERGSAAIYGDDGEKFGVWPGTHKWVFDDGWLERFFEVIEKNLEWIKPVTFSEYVDAEEPLGRIYLPTTSYMEMGEWSLPAEASRAFMELVDEVKGWNNGEHVQRFLQGGVWRNFLSKYPESNWMHKRMLRVSSMVSGMAAARGMDRDVTDATHALYMSECNDAYWHGVFGGLYLPHLRTEVYRNLIRAENLATAEVKDNEPVVEIADVDADGFDEGIVTTPELKLFVSPRAGGALTELDFRPREVNLLNTLSRWEEGYHYKLKAAANGGKQGSGTASIHDVVKVKEEGLEKYLVYDRAKRVSFVDRFIDPDVTFGSFFDNTFNDSGDFHNNCYEVSPTQKGLDLTRDGCVAGARLGVGKKISAEGRNAFGVDYALTRLESGAAEGLRFGVELNVIMPCCDGPACFYGPSPVFSGPEGAVGLGSRGTAEGIEKISVVDSLTGVIMTVAPSRPATLWRFPLYTVSLSEDGFEKIYQGSCLLFLFPAEFKQDVMKLSFRVSVEGVARA